MADLTQTMPEHDRAAFASMIERRLAALEKEREALLVLQRIYAPGATVTVPVAPSPVAGPSRIEVGITADPTMGGARRGGASPPPVTIKPGGLTESILKVVNAHPGGLEAADLIDLVVPIVNSTSTDKRAAISSAARAMADRGYISRRGGVYYPAKSQNGSAQGVIPFAGR